MDTQKLKPLDILLYKGKGFNSWLIRVGTGSIYSHVAVVVDPAINLGIESNVGHQEGVRALDLRKLDDSEVDVFRVKPGQSVNTTRTVSFLVDCLGGGFDWIGVIWLGILKIIGLLTFGGLAFAYHAFQKRKDYFCSELCYAAFNSGGLDIVPEVGEAETTSPGDISRSLILVKI